MRSPLRWLPVAALLAFATLLLPATQPSASAEEAPADYVVVQRSTGHLPLLDRPPTLEEQGFERVPVPPGRDAAEFAAELAEQPGVLGAEPDARVWAAALPNDTFYARDQAGYLGSIGVPGAWDLSVGRPEVVVAVLDSGADLAHPDLASRLWVNQQEVAGNGIDDDGNGCVDDRHGCRFTSITTTNSGLCGYGGADGQATGDVFDDNGGVGTVSHSHGTMVAGIIGAAGNNGEGVAGVGWNIRLMIVKVLDCGDPSGGQPGGQMSDVARGIEYARRMGADVINMSLSSSPGNSSADLAVLRSAIQSAQDAGIIMVAAAGNYGGRTNPSPGYPGAYNQYPSLVTVGASNWTAGQTWANYSSYGPSVDFAAPGNDITSTVRSDIGLSLPYGKAGQGTSYSTPLASGMFALMLSRNSRLPAADYIQFARDAATPAPPATHGGNWAGSGIINVRGAVARIPMLITGFAQHDWVDISEETLVQARVGAKQCGSTSTMAFGTAARFELRVESDEVTDGCGEPGKEVVLYLDGVPAEPSFSWDGPTSELAYTGQDVTTVSPDPGPLVVQQLGNGWNNVAHLEDPGQLPSALSYLPPGWESAYSWNPFERLYQRFFRSAPDYVNNFDTIDTFEAYWVYSTGGSNTASPNPDVEPGRVLSLAAGWNNFVYTGTSQSIPNALAEISGKYTAVYQYDNATATWLSYLPGQSRFLNTIGGLLHLRVYWIYMTEGADVVLD